MIKMHKNFVATYEFRDMLGWRSRVVAILMDFGHSKNILVSGFPVRLAGRTVSQIRYLDRISSLDIYARTAEVHISLPNSHQHGRDR